jgi:hypothetical protein
LDDRRALCAERRRRELAEAQLDRALAAADHAEALLAACRGALWPYRDAHPELWAQLQAVRQKGIYPPLEDVSCSNSSLASV